MDSLSGKDYVTYGSWVLYVVAVILILVTVYLVTKQKWESAFFTGLSGLVIGLGTFYGAPLVSKMVDGPKQA